MTEIEQRTIQRSLGGIHDDIKELRSESRGMRNEVQDLKREIRDNYLSKDRYNADQEVNKIVKNLVFGLVALILVGFVTAVIALVIK